MRSNFPKGGKAKMGLYIFPALAVSDRAKPRFSSPPVNGRVGFSGVGSG